MRSNKTPLRGSVTQNNVSARIRMHEEDGIGFLARLGLLAGVLLVFLLLVLLGWRSGWFSHEVLQLQKNAVVLTKKAQFEVRDVVVEGRHLSSKDDVFDALGVAQGTPILSVDTQEAAARLGKLPWVDSAVVERRLPDTVAVVLTERVPLARWQHDEKVYVIDSVGRVISAAKPEDFTSLPVVVGAGAAPSAQNLLSLLKAYPDIREITDSAVRVSDRRWDLHLTSKIVVRLPESNLDNALHRLSVLIAQEKILDRKIVAIDLRIEDRLVIEPAPDTKESGEKRP